MRGSCGKTIAWEAVSGGNDEGGGPRAGEEDADDANGPAVEDRPHSNKAKEPVSQEADKVLEGLWHPAVSPIMGGRHRNVRELTTARRAEER